MLTPVRTEQLGFACYFAFEPSVIEKNAAIITFDIALNIIAIVRKSHISPQFSCIYRVAAVSADIVQADPSFQLPYCVESAFFPFERRQAGWGEAGEITSEGARPAPGICCGIV